MLLLRPAARDTRPLGGPLAISRWTTDRRRVAELDPGDSNGKGDSPPVRGFGGGGVRADSASPPLHMERARSNGPEVNEMSYSSVAGR